MQQQDPQKNVLADSNGRQLSIAGSFMGAAEVFYIFAWCQLHPPQTVFLQARRRIYIFEIRRYFTHVSKNSTKSCGNYFPTVGIKSGCPAYAWDETLMPIWGLFHSVRRRCTYTIFFGN